jgi:uncharacterized ferredoxin-like protein
MPRLKSESVEMDGVLAIAKSMAVAARTAPKARGVDAIETLVVHGEELKTLAQAMVEHGKKTDREGPFSSNADTLSGTAVVLLIGLTDLRPKKPQKPLDCGACGFGSCAGFLKAERKQGKDYAGPVCMFQTLDLGIALASACRVASGLHVDNRMMWTIGAAACNLGWMESSLIIGIPLSCTGKNVYFDR